MSSFDYLTAKEFRESLERDYAEMHQCIQAQAWKSAQVLAGSIVEAMLIDYLKATTHPERPAKDPMKFDLAEAISICRREKVLSERTADLCSVVRSYRNLIHPGRMVRLNEPPPDKGSATIALALIEMIAEDLAKVLRAKVGLTGEQIVSKLERDANSIAILKHLLVEVSDSQRERLLMDLIPEAYDEARQSNEPFDDTADRLAVAYRIILESSSTELRRKIASEFVRIVRVDDGNRVLAYGRAFFRPDDLRFIPEQHKAMILAHLLGQVSGFHNAGSLKQIAGIARHLTVQDVTDWLDPYVRTIISTGISEKLRDKARQQLVFEVVFEASNEVQECATKRLENWIRHSKNEKNSDKVEMLKDLKEELAPIPF